MTTRPITPQQQFAAMLDAAAEIATAGLRDERTTKEKTGRLYFHASGSDSQWRVEVGPGDHYAFPPAVQFAERDAGRMIRFRVVPIPRPAYGWRTEFVEFIDLLAVRRSGKEN